VRRRILALAGAAVGVGAGLAAQRSLVNRRRRDDPEGGERFGERRGIRSRTIELDDGARIFIEEAGPESKRGAVFVHGSALRTDAWHYQLPGVGDHRLVFYDLRGHGRSQPKGDNPFSVAANAEDLLRVIEDSGLDEAVIVGHSVGGMIGLELCAAHPDLLGKTIKGLVLVNTTYRPPYETIAGGATVAKVERVLRHPLDMLGTQHASIERLRKIIRPSDSVFLAVSFAAFGSHASAKQIDFTYDMMSETPTDVLFDLVKSYRDFDVAHLLDAVTVPALVITGTRDRLTLAEASQHLADNLPKAELKVLEGCGHMTMLERHAEFNDAIGGFLDHVFEDPTVKPKKKTQRRSGRVGA
jgi:pimeloyl-ACP methyl ester carboxylesterase